MLSLNLAAFASALLITSTIALPTSVSSSLSTRATTEQWSIPSMELHMMTKFTGLPGNGPWPENSKYPSTIDFDINMPNYQNGHCHTEFLNGTLPDDLAACSGEGGRVRFRMKEYTALGPRRKELSFVLQVFRVDRVPGQQTILMGEVAITANDPHEPSSYLTCLQGAPFDGLRCKIRGMMSVNKNLIIEAHTSNSSDTTALLAAS
ncbi:hypothetical protein BU25DRAFT_377411 [Macroventuria anomochaeta]|uniref:Uncharacterized protein n=1 Tax=Macroventuria anomochaeta TaxID=301207 RepID=A0ACB6RKZ4_9PLEO|nr:uncharacterized protein BU25DRAFT_377411 [Macroventuria anomochaeta]KAF2622605.1 hypothetical protein BU25DRAFT_377411 [Macroventuria anomochaeta]